MSKRKNNPGDFVRVTDCTQRHQVVGKIELALFGPDGRGGMVQDVSVIKGTVKGLEDSRKQQIEAEKKKGRDWRSLVFAILGGTIVAIINWAASQIHP